MAKVLVYSSDTCPYCVAAKDFLKEKNVDFIERNVTTDPTAKKELIDMKQMGVPVILIDDEMVIGFDKRKLTSLLNLE